MGIAQPCGHSDKRAIGDFLENKASYRPARGTGGEIPVVLLEDLRLVLYLERSAFLFGE